MYEIGQSSENLLIIYPIGKFYLYDALPNYSSKLHYKQHYFLALVHILESHTIKIA